MANFYWVGSTAASVNSLSWNTLTNWRTITNAAAGKTLATWTTPTRLPMGQDYVTFGSVNAPMGTYTPIALPTYSPMIFGGCSAGVTAGAWPGVTAGTSTAMKRGTAQMSILPTYPFSQLGGELNTTILNEWVTQCNALQVVLVGGVPVVTPGVTWSIQFIFGVTGSTADGEPTASYYSPHMGPTGATLTPLTITKPTSFIGEGYIRWMGSVTDYSHSPTNRLPFLPMSSASSTPTVGLQTRTNIFVRGITAGLTNGMAGATYAYDGSQNWYNVGVDSQLSKSGTYQNIRAYNGAIPEVSTPIDSMYTHGDAVIAGHWNSVGAWQSTKGGSIFLSGCTSNAVILNPSYAYVYRTGVTYPSWVQNGISSGSITSYTEYDIISLDQSSNTKLLQIGAASAGVVKSVNTLIVEGDITSSSGFACNYPTGVSGGTGGTGVATIGNLLLYPTLLGADGTANTRPVCSIGYPSSEANFKNTNLTYTNYIYNFNGVGSEWNIGVKGNLNVTEAVLWGGSFYAHPQIANGNNIQVGQLSLWGDATLDLSQAPNHKGMDTNVVFQSLSARLFPNMGSTIALSSPGIEEDLGGYNI